VTPDKGGGGIIAPKSYTMSILTVTVIWLCSDFDTFTYSVVTCSRALVFCVQPTDDKMTDWGMTVARYCACFNALERSIKEKGWHWRLQSHTPKHGFTWAPTDERTR
jgi:hypothetical protein